MCCFLFRMFQTEQPDNLWAALCFFSRFIWSDSINKSSDAGRFDKFQKTKRDATLLKTLLAAIVQIVSSQIQMMSVWEFSFERIIPVCSA